MLSYPLLLPLAFASSIFALGRVDADLFRVAGDRDWASSHDEPQAIWHARQTEAILCVSIERFTKSVFQIRCQSLHSAQTLTQLNATAWL